MARKKPGEQQPRGGGIWGQAPCTGSTPLGREARDLLEG